MVSIIIVNYNTVQITSDCIASIFRFTHNVDFEVILVDNASNDNSVAIIKEQFPQVTVLALSENLGFGKANNQGAAVARGEFLFFLNSDTLLIEDSLEKMLVFFVNNEKRLNIGVLGCLMVDENLALNGFGSKFPNPKDFYNSFYRRIPLIGRLFNTAEVQYDLSAPFFEVDYVLGADMLMRKTIFENFEGFNPVYFMYFEESDLQFAISKSDYKNYIFTETKIIHLEGGSFDKSRVVSNNKRIVVHTSKLNYIKRNFPEEYRIFKIFDFMTLVIAVASLKYSFKENLAYFSSIVKKY